MDKNQKISEGEIKEFICQNRHLLLPVLFYLLDRVAQKKWWLQIGMGAVKKILEELINNYCSNENK